MKNAIRSALRSAVLAARDTVKSNPFVKGLLYEEVNEQQFTNLARHELMLADRVRLSAYRDAIAKAVKPGDVVLDLGTGSGILSLFAARNAPRRVLAIDHSPFIEVARKIAATNNCSLVEFSQVNSKAFAPDERVDIIIQEQMGDDLFDEDMVANILDLKARILKDGGRILPAKFELYIEPISKKPDHVVPYLWDNDLWGVDFGATRGLAELAALKERPEYRSRIDGKLRVSVDQFLCNPEPILTFDLNTLRADAEIPRVFQLSRPDVCDGVLDSFCIYFKAIFDHGIEFDTSPLSRHTHWANRVFRVERRHVSRGSTLSYRLAMDELTKASTWILEPL